MADTDQPSTPVAEPAVEAPVDIDKALESAYSETFTETPTDQPADKSVAPPAVAPVKDELDWSKFDLDKAPPEIRETLYRRFQPRLQERIDALQHEKDQIYERAIQALEGKGAPVAPDIKAQIKEAADAGDISRVAELQGLQFRQEIDSVKTELTRKAAFEGAVQADPTILENQTEIANRLRSNQALVHLANANGGANTTYVIQGLNAQIQREVLQNKLQVLEKNFKAAVADAVKKDRVERTATATRLGTSGSSAGTAATFKREGSDKMNLNKSLEAAWDEIFGGA